MSRLLLAALLLPAIVSNAIYVPGEDITKPPKQRENLQWPQSHANYVPTSPQPSVIEHIPSEAAYRDIVLVHTAGSSRQAGSALCPEKATGQFTYLPDCRKFINCWKGRGFIQACAPGTLFNPKSLECDFPAKVRCLPYENERESESLKEEVIEPEGEVMEVEDLDYVERGMIDVRVGKEYVAPPSSSSSVVHRTSSVSKQLPGSSLHDPHSPLRKEVPYISPQSNAGHYPAPTLYPNLGTHNTPAYPIYQSPISSQKQPLSPLNQVSEPSKTPTYESKVPTNPLAQYYPNSQTTESSPRQDGHPSSGRSNSPSPWLQPPPTSNYPTQHQGRFPTRQPHSLNPAGVGTKQSPSSSLYPPPGNNPVYSQNQPHSSEPQSRYPGGYPQPSGNQQQQFGTKPQYSGTYPQYPGNQQQYPGSYPQSSGNQRQSPGSQQQYPGSYSQSPGSQQQYPGRYPQSPGSQQQYPGSYPQSPGSQQQYPGSYPQSPGSQQQYPGRYPQSPGSQQQYPGNYPQSPGSQQQYPASYPQSPGSQQQYPASYPQSPGSHQQYPASYPQSPGSHQQYPGSNHESSRNQLATTERHPYYPADTRTSTTPRGRDVAAKHKSECSMLGGSGVAPHPTDCGKYLNCWKGLAHTQSCAPGTLFNPALLQCDHPYNVICKKSAGSQEPGPGKKWTPLPGAHQSATTPVYSSPLANTTPSPHVTPNYPTQTPTYNSYPSYPSGYGSNPNPTGYGSNSNTNPSGYGSYPNPNPPGYGSNPSNPPGYGSYPNLNPSGYGSNPSNPPAYGSNPSTPPSYGSNPANPAGYGSNPSSSPGYLSNPSNLPGYRSNPSSPSGYGSNSNPSVNRSKPLSPPTFGSNPPVFNSLPTSKPPIQSLNNPSSSLHGGVRPSDVPSHGSHGFYPPYNPSQTTRSAINTTPQPLTTSRAYQSLAAGEQSLIHEASEVQEYYAEAHGEAPKQSTTSQPPTRVSTKVLTTTKMPSYIMSIPGPGNSQPNKPANATRPNVGYSPSLMTSGQILRLRGGPGPSEGYVEVQSSSPGWGLVCDESNGWNIDEASVVCRQLGYLRGAELSWQGRPVRPTEDTISISVSEVKCSGSEENLSSCRVVRGAGKCLIPRDAVGVRCYRNYASVCQPGEVNHGGKCYSVIVPREDTALEAFSHGEALADCQKRKGKLLDITSQAESDFISELLLQSYPHINSIITSGVGVKVMGHPLWIWEGSGETFKFQKWWPGWTGNETVPTASTVGNRMQCVVAKRVFPCQAPYLPDVAGLANLCEANYFYWATEDCSVTHDHPYMCERSQDDVGCVIDAGKDYMGSANVSTSGESCIPWDSPLTPASLKYRMAYKVRQTTMAGHNHCRNIGGGETHPWCYVGPQAQFQYCDIPDCQSDVAPETAAFPSSDTTECGLNEYECHPGECIPVTLVCNKKEDCSNGNDETDCPDIAACDSNQFECHPRETVIASLLCNGKADCSNGRDEQNCTGVKKPRSQPKFSLEEFECRPKECVLASRVCDGTQDCSNGKDEKECRVGENVVDDTRNCSMKEFECQPGHCIPSLWECDGVKDCPNGNDENNCPGVQKTIAGGLKCISKEFECRPGECILSTWVCDGAKDCSNGIDEKDCSGSLKQFSKQLNRRLIKHDKQKWLELDATTCADYCLNAKDFTCRSFSHRPLDRICLLSDSNVGLSGQLNHTLEWQYYERRSTALQCQDMFQCDNGKCVNKTMVCDGKNNCGDRTDERNCSTEYLGYEIRLSGGNTSNEGRVEVKVFGQWGAICDDLFGLRDADVVCRELNFTLGAAEVVGQSMYGEVKPVFLVDDLQCRGNETTIRECDFDGWGVHDCGPEEAVGVVCRVPGLDCKANYWRCDKSRECIPVGFLCDNVPDCEDGSDESVEHCEAPVELRLVGGPSNMSGRVEVRYHGIWGTVCDDDFSNIAAQVICRVLGFGGPAEAKKDAAFGPGEGQIWLDQVHCTGQETNIEDCLHSQWGENNCAHEEDASVVCSLGEVPKQRSDKNKPKVVATVAVSPDITANQILPAQCGLSSDDYWEMAARNGDRVVGGSEVAHGSFPWQASLRVRTIGKSVHWCGAVVISPLHILTAGHCLQDYTKGAYLIRVGDHDTEANDGTEQEVNIDEIYLHEGFNKGPRLSNDIALVKLKAGGLRLGPAVQPVCLPPTTARYHAGLNCSISGWGSVKAAGSGFSRKLRAAWVSILPDTTCRADFVYGPTAITEGMVCAGDLEGKVDSCQGDSGGPLICLNNGRFTLYGITSWGHGCGRANKPGVYSQVSYFRAWIDQKLKDSMTGK